MNNYSNRGTIMKLVLDDGDRMENHGTIMSIHADAVSDVTIISHGTIMNARGCRIINGNNYQKQEAQGVIIREVARRQDLEQIEQLDIENRKLRADNERLRNNSIDDNDRRWGLRKIKEQKTTIEMLNHKVEYLQKTISGHESTIANLHKECERLRGREVICHLESETENLHNQCGYYEGVIIDLRGRVVSLEDQLKMTDRQQLLDEIDDLKDKLKRALNRERVAIMSREESAAEARRTIGNVWDSYRPTKEDVKDFFKTTRIFMDCETDNEEIFI